MTIRTETYIGFVSALIDSWQFGVPIRSAAIADELVRVFQIEKVKARRMVNVYLARLADRKMIVRLAHGVYAKAKATVFGSAVPGKEKLIADSFIRDNGEVIGYETGAVLLNRLGFTTLVPREQQIATNRYRAVVPKGSGITTKKPLAPVTTENAPYFQMVEVIKDLHNHSLDAADPESLVSSSIDLLGLDRMQLVRYLNTFMKPKDLKRAVDVVLGKLDLHETT